MLPVCADTIEASRHNRMRHSERCSQPRDRRSALLTHPCKSCMAPMYPPALLDGPDIIIFILVDVTRFLSSSLEPRLRHPDRIPLLLPGARSTGKWRFLLPRPFATLSIWALPLSFRPHLRMGPFFCPHGPTAPLHPHLQKMHGSRAEAAFVRRALRVDNCSRQFAASPPPWPRWLVTTSVMT
jgi:hypothetical protein